MNKCTQCGFALSEDDVCCGQCGTPVLPDLASQCESSQAALANEHEEVRIGLASAWEDVKRRKKGIETLSEKSEATERETDPREQKVVKRGIGWNTGLFDLANDVLVPFLEKENNSLRILFRPNVDGLENVVLRIEPQDGVCVKNVWEVADATAQMDSERKFLVRNLGCGSVPCDVFVEFDYGGQRHSYIGDFDLCVTERSNAEEQIAKNLTFHFDNSFNGSFNTDIKAEGHDAGDAKVSGVDGSSQVGKAILESLKGANALDKIKGLVDSGGRTYCRIPMRECGCMIAEPSPEAKVKEIEVRLGYNRVQFFVDDIICIGHSVDGVRYSDIVIDAPSGMNVSPYDRISRIHCMIRHYGANAEICDGRVDLNGQVVPSSNGTVLNMERLPPRTTRPLRDGELCLGASSGAVKLGVRLVPAAGCEYCKIAKDERVSCAGGERPCVVISRPDDLHVKYVALWSCFDLGNINLDYKGIVIFHYNGAFGWRRGKKTGWLKSGENFGSSQFSKVTVLKVWDR